ncbi:MAG: response regulator [Acetobacteraceae bacterium]|nr:response regulator [Acetobacteraceae bacterium]
MAIVDDDPAVLDSLRFLLELCGLEVTTYGSAAAFLDNAQQLPSCVILDQHMPQMTGLDLAVRLRSRDADLPVLLITGSSSPAIVARAAQLRIQVLEKPPDEADLMRFIEARL